MELLKEAIRKYGKVIGTDVLLVDTFLNHQVDVKLMKAVGEDFAEHFRGQNFTRVMTIESSGIAPAAFTALAMDLPLVIMKKRGSRILDENLVQTTVLSFTKGTQYQLTVSRNFISPDDNILFIDDFLARGEAAFGMLRIAEQVGAKVGGIGIVIEKAFQPGHGNLEAEGHPVYSLARVKSMSPGNIEFID